MKFYDSFSTMFSLAGKPGEEQLEMVAELNAILEPMGSSISIEENEFQGEIWYALYVKLNPDAVAKHKSRGAGRHRQLVRKDGRVVTIGQVKEMLKTGTAESVAKELGISRSTLFRRLKEDAPDQFLF